MMNILEKINARLPKLPVKIIDLLVYLNKTLALPIGILGIIFSISVLAFTIFVSRTLNMDSNIWLKMSVSSVVILVSSIWLLMAYPHLKKNLIRGWSLIFWITVLGDVNLIFNFFISGFSIFSMFGIFFGYYLLFQMKPRYH
ncbi:MAG: hypothetical protein UT84_C0002G0002 [Candidatus Curtissbacteria bacterium GW2011_GWA1_40_16]|uniref:Uncharacterized protein n=1 Tax=Candidatus Curtissbacteria bacterium GW2011_GWA1_40_16 TaxID=1618405 RepID=A0A0G0RMQ1_9BACT|nr:MAG: hypothetical protein UT84_C0002G0002 [Candidatus Curtissbacteria bacterium GW2011_GWA1_40_16]